MLHKYVVFDLDETLGYFVEINIFIQVLFKIMDITVINQNEFNQILMLYIEIFRPGIFSILSYIKHAKLKNKNLKVVIYSNNQISKEWVLMICNFINFKLNTTNFFDNIITAYKIDDKLLEICRSSNHKTINDLKKCICSPINSKYLFIDDQNHSNMNNINVKYIIIEPYINSIGYNKMINKFIKSEIYDNLSSEFNKSDIKNRFLMEISGYEDIFINNHNNNICIHKKISKYIMFALIKFCKVKNKTTKSNSKRIQSNKTKKNTNN